MEEEYRPHTCDVCGKRFKQGNQLRQHTMIHLPPDQRPYKCEICEKTFTRSHHLKLHRLGHTGQKLFYCDICDRQYNQACNLRCHMMVHDQSKQRPCPVCGRNFVCEKALKTHMDKHLPKESCQCMFCKKTLLRKNMKQHMKMHVDRRTIFCSICNKWSVSKDNFETHFARHKRRPNEEHICSACGRKFLRLGNYENHLITHSGYTPYICEQCNKGFLQAGSYKRHMKVHGAMENQPAKGMKKRRERGIPTKSLKLFDSLVLSGRSTRRSQNDFSPHTYDYIRGSPKSTSGKRQVVHGNEKSMSPMKVEKGYENEMASQSSGFPTSGQSNRCLKDDFSPHTYDYYIGGSLKSTNGKRQGVCDDEKSMPSMKAEKGHENEMASQSLGFPTFDQSNRCLKDDFSPHTYDYYIGGSLKSTSGKRHGVCGDEKSMPPMEAEKGHENEMASQSSWFPTSGQSNRCLKDDFSPHTYDYYIGGSLKSTSGKRQGVCGDEKSMPPMKVDEGHENEMASQSSGFLTSGQSNPCLKDDFSLHTYDYYIGGLLKSTSGEKHVVHEKSMSPMKVEEWDVNEIASNSSESSAFRFPLALSSRSNICSQNDFSPHTCFLKSTSGNGHVVYGHTESMPAMKVEEEEDENETKSSEFFPSDLPFTGFSQYSYQNCKPVFHNIENKMDTSFETEEIEIFFIKSSGDN